MNIMSVSEPDSNLDAEKRSITGVLQRILTAQVGERWRTRDL